jgi:hypothetical protein
VRRALDAQVDTERRLNDTLAVDKDGRMGIKAARGGGLVETKQGLMVDKSQVGEMNREPIAIQRDLDPTTATAAQIATALNALLKELRRTGNMRSGGF